MENKQTSDFDQFQEDHAKWAMETFPDETLEEVLKHLNDEISEAQGDPNDISEWGDAYLLLMYAAHRVGHKVSDIFKAAKEKHEINKKRTWGGKNEKGIYQHVE